MYRKGGTLVIAVLYACCAMAKEMSDIEVLMTSRPIRCTYEYAYDMYGAHCGGLRLPKIPSLRSGIEILDFSDNKLQELQSDTFSRYTSLKFLYLSENQIYHIAEDALSSLTDLQTLDLSKNVILKLPDSIFQMPSLQKLYLGGNPLLHLSLNELSITTIRAPLQLLDLSDCKIKILPDWGILPHLVFYNISNNPLKALDVKHFSVMCNLERVDLSKSFNEMRLCDVKPAVSWFQDKGVYFQLDDYTKLNSREYEDCPFADASVAAHNATYHRCKREYLQVQASQASRKTWLTISGSLAGFLVGFMLLLYLMHRHNVAQTKKGSDTMKKVKPSDGDKHAIAGLLHDVS